MLLTLSAVVAGEADDSAAAVGVANGDEEYFSGLHCLEIELACDGFLPVLHDLRGVERRTDGRIESRCATAISSTSDGSARRISNAPIRPLLVPIRPALSSRRDALRWEELPEVEAPRDADRRGDCCVLRAPRSRCRTPKGLAGSDRLRSAVRKISKWQPPERAGRHCACSPSPSPALFAPRDRRARASVAAIGNAAAFSAAADAARMMVECELGA